MFRNTALSNTPTFKLILGFGLCTLGGAMLYAYFKQRDEEDAEEQRQNQSKTQKSSSSPTKSQKSPVSQKEIKIEFKITNEHIPLIAGRQGANLKSVEDRTQTKINFR